MKVRPVLERLYGLGVGAVLLLGLVGCIASPRIVGPVHPPIPPLTVRVFISPIIPRHYMVVAKLDASGYGGCSSPGLDRIVLATLRKQAARLGANGVLLIPDRHFHSYPIGPGHYVKCIPRPPVTAEAIYFPHLKSNGRS